jgi:phosphatidylinositol alpha-1,6-mannosyltransferase
MSGKTCLMVVTGIDHLGGGIARVNRLVRQALQEGGYRVEALALGEAGRPEPGVAGFNNRKIGFTLATWQRLSSRRYDLVFCDHANLAAMLAPLATLKRLRYTVWLHGAEVFSPRPDFEGRLGLKYAWRRLASSEFTGQQVTARFPGWPVQACELALDPSIYGTDLPPVVQPQVIQVEMPAMDGSRQALGEQVILFVGRLDPLSRYKGQSVLLQAFPSVQERFPDAQLVIAGEGPDLAYNRSLAGRLDGTLHSKIFFPGYLPQPDLSQLYRKCFAFAMPSAGEGFGLVYIEAMAHARPCLASCRDAAAGVIVDGQTGLLVQDGGSVEAVAGGLIALLSDPNQAGQMGLAGYARVRQNYLFPHFKARFLSAIGETPA